MKLEVSVGLVLVSVMSPMFSRCDVSIIPVSIIAGVSFSNCGICVGKFKLGKDKLECCRPIDFLGISIPDFVNKKGVSGCAESNVDSVSIISSFSSSILVFSLFASQTLIEACLSLGDTVDSTDSKAGLRYSCW